MRGPATAELGAAADTSSDTTTETQEASSSLHATTATLPDPAATGSTVASSVVAPAAATATVDVIVVGAGLAGLKAAADLKASGYNVVVLEGRSRIGGRVLSMKLGTGSTVVEVGAQW